MKKVKQRIGIMGAMLEEIEALKEVMSIHHETVSANRVYYEGELEGRDVVLVFSRWGKVAASSTVTTLITQFNITHLIFTGVSGSAKEHIKVGDIIVSSGLYQHDMNSEPLYPAYEIPLTETALFQPCPHLVSAAEMAVQDFLTTVDTTILTQHNIEAPKSYKGVIASGDQFITNAHSHKDLQGPYNALTVEMEGAAVAQVCHEHDIPFVVIRTISDDANSNAPSDFQSFAEHAASYFCANIVTRTIANLHEQAQKKAAV